jgi:ADP-ribosyl-[dinitrogen reductase] hydrolase
MFFANLVHRKLPPVDCPDNDGHNVDTIDGLILPTIVSLAEAARPSLSPEQRLEQAAAQSASCVRVTRNSNILEQAAAAWSQLIVESVIRPATVKEAAENVAKTLSMRRPQARAKDEVTACYLGSAMPSLLDSVVKYNSKSVWTSLLSNANLGGENVHRGSVLGACLGAASSPDDNDKKLVQGLYDHDSLENEIDDFVRAVMNSKDE